MVGVWYPASLAGGGSVGVIPRLIGGDDMVPRLANNGRLVTNMPDGNDGGVILSGWYR